jgi:hypothetical protein
MLSSERTGAGQGLRLKSPEPQPESGPRSDALDAKSLEHQLHNALNFCFEKDDTSLSIHLVSISRGSCRRTTVANRVWLLSGRDIRVARGLLDRHAIRKEVHGSGSRIGKNDVLQKPGQFL